MKKILQDGQIGHGCLNQWILKIMNRDVVLSVLIIITIYKTKNYERKKLQH